MKYKLEQLNSILQKALSELIARRLPQDTILISDLLISQNFRNVKVYLNTSPALFQKINQERVQIQKELGEKLKLRYTPIILFLINDNYLDKIENLFERIKK